MITTTTRAYIVKAVDVANDKARKASFSNELRAVAWANAMLQQFPGVTLGFTVQTRDVGSRPWFVRFMDK